MKAYLDAQGSLHIEPETPLEVFALAQWSKLAMEPGAAEGSSSFKGQYIVMHTSIATPPEWIGERK